MSKRAETSASSIGMMILVMNIEKILKDFLFVIFVYVVLGNINQFRRYIYSNNSLESALFLN